MTTPATPPSLAALYAERATLAYLIETIRPLYSDRATLLRHYDALQVEIATQAAQWPARWGRTQEGQR